MIDDMLVVDAVVHAFDATEANTRGDYGVRLLESICQFQQDMFPDELGDHRLSRERFFQPMPAEALSSALFRESATDAAIYHSIPAWGILKDLSPLAVGEQLKALHPDRVFLYAAVSPVEGPRAIEELERQAERIDPIGLKLYPVDIIDGKLRQVSLSDETHVYPVLERCRELGIRTVAIHKALPIGTAPTDVFHPGDVDHAAADFPDLTFEIVHGGFAWTDETAFQVARFPNIVVNLEATSALLLQQPRMFAQVFGKLLMYGGAKKLLWGTGAMPHPGPFIEAFARFEMPEDLVRGYGFPEVTDEMKRQILGGNAIELHKLTVEPRAAAEPVEPWSALGTPETPDELARAV